jgi:hypothetical protein
MKRNTTVARLTEADVGLERITHLAEQLAPAPVNSRQHRTLSAAIRIEAAAYRKSLDTEQATATHDAKPQPAVGRGSLNRTSASRTPTLVPRRRIHHRRRPLRASVLKEQQDQDR